MGDVNLKLPTEVAYPTSNLETIFGGWDSNGHTLRVSGMINNAVAVEGKVDISALQFEGQQAISIAAWRETPTVVVGAHEVTLFGPLGCSFNLQVAPQAKIHMWFVGAVPVDLKDVNGTPIPYDVSMVNWRKSSEGENVILIGSADMSLTYEFYTNDLPIDFIKAEIPRVGESSLTLLAPVTPIVDLDQKFVVKITKDGVGFFYTPFLGTGNPTN